jgi:hypothetical protein
MLNRLLLAIVPVVLGGCGHSAASPSPHRPPAAESWSPAFTTLASQSLRPTDDPATKAVVLVFLIRDCPIANSYLPELNRLHDAFSSRGVRLFLVQADSETTADQARKHAAEYEIRPPVVLDPRHQWVKKCGATVSPQAAVFTSAGELVYRGRINDQYIGLGKRRSVVTSHDLHDALEALLAGRPIERPRTEAVGCPIPSLESGE